MRIKWFFVLLAIVVMVIACRHETDEVVPPDIDPSALAVSVDLDQVPYPTLSAYHFFTGVMVDQTPNGGVLPYDVIVPVLPSSTNTVPDATVSAPDTPARSFIDAPFDGTTTAQCGGLVATHPAGHVVDISACPAPHVTSKSPSQCGVHGRSVPPASPSGSPVSSAGVNEQAATKAMADAMLRGVMRGTLTRG